MLTCRVVLSLVPRLSGTRSVHARINSICRSGAEEPGNETKMFFRWPSTTLIPIPTNWERVLFRQSESDWFRYPAFWLVSLIRLAGNCKQKREGTQFQCQFVFKSSEFLCLAVCRRPSKVAVLQLPRSAPQQCTLRYHKVSSYELSVMYVCCVARWYTKPTPCFIPVW